MTNISGWSLRPTSRNIFPRCSYVSSPFRLFRGCSDLRETEKDAELGLQVFTEENTAVDEGLTERSANYEQTATVGRYGSRWIAYKFLEAAVGERKHRRYRGYPEQVRENQLPYELGEGRKRVLTDLPVRENGRNDGAAVRCPGERSRYRWIGDQDHRPFVICSNFAARVGRAGFWHEPIAIAPFHLLLDLITVTTAKGDP